MNPRWLMEDEKMSDDRLHRCASIGEIVEAWCDRRITTSDAIGRGDFDGFAELLETAITSGVPLRQELTPAGMVQADMLTALLSNERRERTS